MFASRKKRKTLKGQSRRSSKPKKDHRGKASLVQYGEAADTGNLREVVATFTADTEGTIADQGRVVDLRQVESLLHDRLHKIRRPLVALVPVLVEDGGMVLTWVVAAGYHGAQEWVKLVVSVS